ncbi:hypothetical protein POVCU2_0034780 [Plasmodium ovale curtisi]|uniref:AMMECR1 domain-containing protein n=1 Tax=Plasmodium ovale curtisi TaxID=864141 RepID=A0A1A8VZU1_PLAOA|nr:hypothetical protein POVCU2_0034780 [Plasmodium ovale curtisi]
MRVTPGRKEKWRTRKPEAILRHRINDKLQQKCDSPFKFSKAYDSKMAHEESQPETYTFSLTKMNVTCSLRESSVELGHSKDAVSELIEEKNVICSWCFDILEHELKKKKFDYIPPVLQKLHKNGFKIPFFVKWMKLNDVKNMGSYDYDEYELKGCIGCLSEIDVYEIRYYALQSSLNDNRFYPITLNDLPYLIVTITYLFNFEECKHIYDWVIGKHGIKLNFTVNKRKYSSTFLPDVASQHNFDHKTTIKKLIRKANYRGEINDELLNIIQVERYEGVNCSLTYADYLKLQHT